MKVANAFAHVFAIIAFLTFGSLLIIVSLHILSVDDAVLKIHEVYASPWRSFQTGLGGLLFIMVGLGFAKMIVKKGRESETLIFQSGIGPIVVSVAAIEDVVKKVLKRFHLVKEWKIKTLLQGKDVKIKIRLVMWTESGLTPLLAEIQEEVRARVKKLLGRSNGVEVACDVHRIEDHEAEPKEDETNRPKAVASV